jgi:hypothetical protein
MLSSEAANLVAALPISGVIVTIVLYFLKSRNEEIKGHIDYLNKEVSDIKEVMVRKDELKEKLSDSLYPLQESIRDIKLMLSNFVKIDIKSNCKDQ